VTTTPAPGADSQTDERFSFELAARKGLDTAITGFDFQRNDDDEYKWFATRRLYEFWKEAGRAALVAASAPVQQSECKWPSCMSEKEQKDLADEIARDLYTGEPVQQPADENRPTSGDFDAWFQSPYTKALQKSIAEDYAPAGATSDEQQGQWVVRERRNPSGDLIDCFVEAPKEGEMAYALEVLGDDYTGYGEVERKLEHCKLIVSSVNATLAAPNGAVAVSEVMTQIQAKLKIMLASATALDDGDCVTGYQIKNGALHAILGIMAGAGYSVTIPLPSPTQKAAPVGTPVARPDLARADALAITREYEARALPAPQAPDQTIAGEKK
jgi:hypothetical protein